MKNFLIVIALVTMVAFAANAQSKDCSSKEKGETTKVEKSIEIEKTMKSGDKIEKSTSTALTNGNENVQKEIVLNKIDKEEKCAETSSCCDTKKEKIEMKVEKEIKRQ